MSQAFERVIILLLYAIVLLIVVGILVTVADWAVR